MMKQSRPIGRMLVLDLETRPDPQAITIVPRGREISRVALHRITAFSTLSAREEETGEWSAFHLASANEDDEHALLMELDEQLSGLADSEGLLVTYNGVAHDAAVLRRRAAAHWMFGMPGLGQLDSLTHRDLFRDHARDRRSPFPSLRDACAGYGIPCDHLLVSQSRTVPLQIRKSQTDCVATFLLALYEIALERGCEAPLVRGWTALARFLGEALV